MAISTYFSIKMKFEMHPFILKSLTFHVEMHVEINFNTRYSNLTPF